MESTVTIPSSLEVHVIGRPTSTAPVESVSVVTVGIEDPETIDAAEYSIIGDRRRSLYRLKGWSAPSIVPAAGQAGGAELYSYSISMVAGWVPPGTGPGTVSIWIASTAYVAGAFVKPVAGAALHLFECTTPGTSGGPAEPVCGPSLPRPDPPGSDAYCLRSSGAGRPSTRSRW